jgi:Fe-S-cluster containining protein
MIVRSLTIHASYACAHSGACCTAQWPIPIEADRLATLIEAERLGTLTPRSTRLTWYRKPPEAPPETPARLAFDERGCVFHDAAPAARCRIHSALGHDVLPLACRQFPRVSVIDPRGVSVTLSHYCPTAARLLERDIELGIIARPPAFPSTAEFVGLDVRTSLPPLLGPKMLMDWEAWWTWEELAVSAVAHASSPIAAMEQLWWAVEAVRDWRPGAEPLLERIRRAFADSHTVAAGAQPLSSASVVDGVVSAIPQGLRPRTLETVTTSPAAIRAFLAAHAFANWIAHLGRGLRTWLRSIEAAYVLANEYGVRQADLLLRHLADPHHLADIWSEAEARSR